MLESTRKKRKISFYSPFTSKNPVTLWFLDFSFFCSQTTHFSAVLSIASERTAFLFSILFPRLSFAYSATVFRLFCLPFDDLNSNAKPNSVLRKLLKSNKNIPAYDSRHVFISQIVPVQHKSTKNIASIYGL